MILAIEYWNKVEKDAAAPFGRKVLPEVEVKSRWSFNGNIEELKKRLNNHPRMTIETDKITEDTGSYYGIRSYIEYTQA